MSLPNSYMLLSPQPSTQDLEARKHFLSLVEEMDLPKHRVLNHDYHWMLRNAHIRNWKHPKFDELMLFLRKKISD